MNKKIMVIFTLPILCILLTGCFNTNKSVNISMNCNNDLRDYTIKNGDVLKCTLLNQEYNFVVSDVKDDSFKISVQDKKGGLSSTGSVRESEYEWIVKKGEKLEIDTTSMDYQQTVAFSIK